jgi:hypothetical protein
MSINTEPDLDLNNLVAIVTEKNKKIRGLKTEKDSEVGALNNQLKLRNISVYELYVSCTDSERNSSISMLCAYVISPDLAFPFCRVIIDTRDSIVSFYERRERQRGSII